MSLIKAIRRFLNGWWQNDRVRIAPDQGRLLQLQPPCYLRINGRTLSVESRQAIVTPEQPEPLCSVVYRCTDDGGTGTLRVTLLALKQAPVIIWQDHTDANDSNQTPGQALSAASIEIFQTQ